MNQDGKTKADQQREYNRNYYKRNRSKISMRRKARYRTDDKKRKQLQQAALRHYHSKTKKKDRTGYSVKIVDGIHLYSIQYCSAVTGKSTDLLRQWEKDGIIPLTTYTDSRGWRLYTDHQLNILSAGFRMLAQKEFTKLELANYLKREWTGSEETEDAED